MALSRAIFAPAGRIELRDSAVVKGDIVAERLSIEENASIKGKVELSEKLPGPTPGNGSRISQRSRNPLIRA